MPKLNLNNKKIILGIIVFLIFSFLIYNFLKKNNSDLSFEEVKIGNILQTVSESGQVQKEEKINLNFKNSGRVEKIFVNVGDKVAAGKQLMKLETNELYIKLQEAKSNLAVAVAKLDKLITGATSEEVKVGQTKVNNKEILLNAAKQNLENEYQDALTILDDAYLKSYNAKNAVDYIQRTYFNSSDQEGLQVKDSKDRILRTVSLIKAQIDFIKLNNTNENIDSALLKTKEELSATANALVVARESCETPYYQSLVSSADKTSLDTQRLNINTVLNSVISVQQTIGSKKLATTEAEGNLQTVKDDLGLLIAPARQEDVNLYKAEVDEARAQAEVLENQIQDAYLKSPVEGQITDIKNKIGELVQPTTDSGAIVIMPEIPYAVETDIYEEDVVKTKIGNSVDISLVAFPDKIFKGKIVSIDPAEKMIEGVVYYKTIISFIEIPQGLRPGMTADVVINTDIRENVLIVSESAIQKKDDKEFVEVIKNDKKEEREIKTGLLGNDGMVEILFGLKEGEKIILPF